MMITEEVSGREALQRFPQERSFTVNISERFEIGSEL
jgi:hypothetical protein